MNTKTKSLIKTAAITGGLAYLASRLFGGTAVGVGRSGVAGLGYGDYFQGDYGAVPPGYGRYHHIINPPRQRRRNSYRHWGNGKYNYAGNADNVMPDTFPDWMQNNYGYNPYYNYGGYGSPFYNPVYMEQPGSTAATSSLLDATESGN